MVQRVPTCAPGTSDRIFRIEVICTRLLQISLLDGVVPARPDHSKWNPEKIDRRLAALVASDRQFELRGNCNKPFSEKAQAEMTDHAF